MQYPSTPKKEGTTTNVLAFSTHWDFMLVLMLSTWFWLCRNSRALGGEKKFLKVTLNWGTLDPIKLFTNGKCMNTLLFNICIKNVSKYTTDRAITKQDAEIYIYIHVHLYEYKLCIKNVNKSSNQMYMILFFFFSFFFGESSYLLGGPKSFQKYFNNAQ